MSRGEVDGVSVFGEVVLPDLGNSLSKPGWILDMVGVWCGGPYLDFAWTSL